MSDTFDPLELLRQSQKAKKSGGTSGFDPAAILAQSQKAKLSPPPTISAETRPYYTSRPFEAFGSDISAADIGEALPGIGATIAGFFPRAPGLKGALATSAVQGAGGALGEAGRQALAGMGGVNIQDPANVALEGGKQALAGLGGEALLGTAKGVAKGVKSAAARPMGRAVERGAAEFNLPPPPESGPLKWLVENTMLGRYAAKKGARPGLDKAAREVGEAAETLGVAELPAELQNLSAKELKAKIGDVMQNAKAAQKAEMAEAKAAVDAREQELLRALESRTATGKAGSQAALTEARAAIRKEAATARANLEAEFAGKIPSLEGEKMRLRLRAMQEADDAVKLAVHDVLTTMGPQEAGMIVKGGLTAGQKIANAEADRLYAEVLPVAKEQGVVVDISDWKARMVNLMKGTEPFHDAKLKLFHAFVVGTSDAKGVVTGGLSNVIPFETAHSLQSQLRETLPSFRLILGRNKKPAAELRTNLKGLMDVALDEQAPALKAPYHKAQEYYADYIKTYDQSIIPKVVKANPEDFVEPTLLPAKGITEAQALRRAIIGDAERYGDDQQKAAAKEAALAWQGTFVRQRLMDGGVENLPARLKDFAPEVVDTVMTATPEGRTLIANLRTVATAVEEAGPRIEAQIASERDRLMQMLAGRRGEIATSTVEKRAAVSRAAQLEAQAQAAQNTTEKRRIQDEARAMLARVGTIVDTPEKQAALQRLGLIEDVLGRAEAGTAKQSIWFSIAMGMGGLGFLAAKAIPLSGMIGLSEASGGVLAKALYDPAWAAQFAKNVELTGRSLQHGAPALARLIDAYMKREKRAEEQQNSWKYLTPPPSLIEPARGRVVDPFLSPPPR